MKKKMVMRYYIFIFLVILFASPVVAQSESDEIIFKAMQDEMKRTREQLVLPGMTKPFYVAYSVARSRQVDVAGVLGGIVNSNVTGWATVCTAQLLLGDYQHTNDTRYVGAAPDMSSASELNYNTLRRSFWLLSDRAYKFALQEDAAKKAYLKTNLQAPEIAALPELTKAEPIKKIVERKKPFDFDQARWEKIVSEVSAIFKEYKDIYNSSVTVTGSEIDFYKQTSEGVILKQPTSYISFYATGYVLTDDGVKISDSYSLMAATPQDLPSLEELKKGVRAFAEDLLKLKTVPVIDEYYSGPVLFEGAASSSIFVSTLLNQSGLFALRAPLGQKEQPRTLENRVGRKILDTRLTVKNYSTLEKYNGVDLLGAYEVDAEGVVPAKEMTLVENGILKTFLNGRVPTLKAPGSTGSSRFLTTGSNVVYVTAPGTIHIQVEDGMKQEKMKKALIKAAKEEGLDYAYIVRDFGGLSAHVYKVDVKDGSETQVRFGKVSGINLSKMKRVLQISSKENIANYILHRQTLSSLIYPASVLIEDIEINESKPGKEKKMALTYPLQRQ
ncbi:MULTISPECIES: metallopeptidase TldD-related protein [Butyricimonas]|uniref:metallopeptidase TldD-related protein n=1 Tax=Butyricimonas TaxID=574697 RepID=UPI001E2B5CB9|nr:MULTISPECIES: metallopeptidase TldD-related protein [Butyricimonas]